MIRFKSIGKNFFPKLGDGYTVGNYILYFFLYV